MAWIVAQLFQNALRMLAVVAGIFFLGGWAWFAYVIGHESDARVLPMTLGDLNMNGAGQGSGAASASERAPAPEPAEIEPRKVFGGLLPVETLLASKVAPDRGEGTADCSYAIVRIGSGASKSPPTSRMGTAWWEAFGGDWRRTPTMGTGREPLEACNADWDIALSEELRQALDAPGNWYMRDGEGTDLHIYSAKDRIAARIRYGD